jgi:hypothetical protein
MMARFAMMISTMFAEPAMPATYSHACRARSPASAGPAAHRTTCRRRVSALLLLLLLQSSNTALLRAASAARYG